MRTFLVALLLAGAASPALAAPDDDNARPGFRGARAERSEAPADRAPRSEMRIERSERGDLRPERVESGPRREVQMPRDLPGFDRRADVPRGGFERPQRVEASPADESDRRFVRTPSGFEDQRVETPGERALRRHSGDTVRDWRSRERNLEGSPSAIEERNLRRAPATERSGGDLVQQRRPLPRVLDRDQRRVSRTPVFGTEPPPPATASSTIARTQNHWRTDWRRDRRYDWRDWRNRHRSHFRIGFYYDPFGWDYFRYGVGWRLWPSYYSSRYWLRDPWEFRLPPAYGPYRWIRYHDDALLVNIYSGEVVDVVYNFFW
jgi:hypothetical protein